MTIDEFQQKLILARAKVISSRARLALQAAHDLNATIKLRIQEAGQKAQGGLFSPYAPITVKQRKARGYQTNFVDFTRK
jgi:hypothetical protein